jgi:hypothetical protein
MIAMVLNFAAIILKTVIDRVLVAYEVALSAMRNELKLRNGTEPGDTCSPIFCYGLAPCFDNNSAILPYPYANASCLGVRPYALRTLAFAPRSIKS